MTILYEDNHLLVVVKPVNMPVQRDASGDDDLLSMAKRYVKERYGKPGDVYLGLVHRLDRPVGGVIAFARTSKAAARLSAQIREHAMHRRYLCIVQGTPPPTGRLLHWLYKDEGANISRVVPQGTAGAKEAILSFERMGAEGDLSYLKVTLHTGRSHQIRVQCAAEGYPLWGDARYGGGRPGEQIALFAHSLTLEHPTKREPLTFTADPPAGFPWNLFVH